MTMCRRVALVAGSVIGITGTASLAGEGATSTGDIAPPVLFVEKPGDMEFSGSLIVRPLQEHRRARANALIARDTQARTRLAAMTVTYYPEVDEYIVHVPAGSPRGVGENQLAIELMATGDYEYVVPNWTCYPIATPNDPMYSNQWHHPKIGSPTAWNYTFGSSTIISAATDTGIDTTHPDLAPHRVPGYNAPANKAEVDGGAINDVNGHGTHVAGCAAAVGNNAKGVSGVNMNARIMMCRVTDASGGGASIAEILEGARWAADNGAKVIGSSYSGVTTSSIQTTGEYIRSKGAIYCYAAGNDSANLTSFDYKDVIVVGASDSGDNRAGFSAYGRGVDVFSPGVNILSTVVGGGYQAWSGTSMATPVCNGALTMIWSANPSLTATQVENILFYACDDLGTAGEDETYGWGRINVGRAVQWAVGPAPAVAVGDSVFALSSIPQTIDVLANDVALDGGSFTMTSHSAISTRGGTIQRVVGGGPGGRDALRYTPPATSGADSFSYTIQGTAGGPSNATVQVNVESSAGYLDPVTTGETAPGMGVSYYDLNAPTQLPNFSQLTPFKTDVVERLSFASTNSTFSTSERKDNFGALYEGYITVDQPSEYTFFSNSDDGSKVYIDGVLVVNNDGLKSSQAWAFSMVEKSGKVKLKAGTHSLRVELFERTGSVGLFVSIAGPGLDKQVIPASMLSHDAPTCSADFDGSGFLDIEDFDAFVAAFEAGDESADFDSTGFVDIEDYDAFIEAFEAGC